MPAADSFRGIVRSVVEIKFGNAVIVGDEKIGVAGASKVGGGRGQSPTMTVDSDLCADFFERAVPQIIAAMQQTAVQPKPVKRLIVLGSAGALPNSLDKQPAWRRWIVQNIVYKIFLKWPVAS